MPQPQKIKRVEEIAESLTSAKSIFMTDFQGLTVEEMNDLRREFDKAGVKYMVVKNTLARISAQQVGFEQMLPYLTGPTGLALSFEDPIAPVRIIFDFKKGREKPTIKAAILEGELLDEKAAEEMRNIPPREVLLGQVVSGMAAPISGFVGALKSMLTNLVYALDQIREQKES